MALNTSAAKTKFIKLLVAYKEHASLEKLVDGLKELLGDFPRSPPDILAVIGRQAKKNLLSNEAQNRLRECVADFEKSYFSSTLEGDRPSELETIIALDDEVDTERRLKLEFSDEDLDDIATEIDRGIELAHSRGNKNTKTDDAVKTVTGEVDAKADAATVVTGTGDAATVVTETGDAATVVTETGDAATVVTGTAAEKTADDVLGSQDDGFYVTGGSADESDELIGPGSIIKDRFLLQRVLGSGGMGTVYLAIDLIKEEAKDKNAHVALKVLNEDFKQHKDSFIALQRESSRQQRLAHPNITTVYDFDRVYREGKQVFIVMEHLDGSPLNSYIKDVVRKDNGLSFKKAMPIIRQLCSGLGYAHQRKLVHSDFKPGNAFLCKDGAVKILDFGIARATKNPLTGEADKTLFDATSLGALTPAYASLEMLEGETPDTRDDIYALGCVVYELLTGKHPFKKIPANSAKSRKMHVASIKGLSKRQNRALKQALAFERKDRSPSVEHFLEQLEDAFVWYKNPYAVVGTILFVAAVGLVNPTINYVKEREISQIIEEISSEDETRIAKTMERLNKIDSRRRFSIVNGKAKESLQKYLSARINHWSMLDEDNFDFPKGQVLLDKIALFYPDSRFFPEQRENFLIAKNQAISGLQTEAFELLDEKRDGESSVSRIGIILKKVRDRIDPNSPLLTDQRFTKIYQRVAGERAKDNDLAGALAMVREGLAWSDKDPTLLFVEEQYSNLERAAQLKTQIEGFENDLDSLVGYKKHEAMLSEWSKLLTDRKNSSLQLQLTNHLSLLARDELDTIKASGDRPRAEKLVADYGNLLQSFWLIDLLTEAKLALLLGDERKRAAEQILQNNLVAIESALQQPNASDLEWKLRLSLLFNESEGLLQEAPAFPNEVNDVRKHIAQVFADAATGAVAKENFDVATLLIGEGAVYSADNEELLDAKQLILESRKAKERQTQVTTLKSVMDTYVQAGEITSVKKTLLQLREILPNEDLYFTAEAPRKLASSYLALAKTQVKREEFKKAYDNLEEGLAIDPGNEDIKELRDKLLVDRNIAELEKAFSEEINYNAQKIKSELDQIQNSSPSRYAKARDTFISQLVKRINALQKRNDSVGAAATLAHRAAETFPGSPVLEKLKNDLELKPWPSKNIAEAALAIGDFKQATKILEESRAKYGKHPEFISFSNIVEERKKNAASAYQVYLEAKKIAAGDFTKLLKTQDLLVKTLALWGDDLEYIKEREVLAKLIDSKRPVTRIAREDLSSLDGDEGELGAISQKWEPIRSGRECEPKLAGYGRRAKAVCFNMIHEKWRGPLMVVIPPDESKAEKKTFAISKYEIAVRDYNKYCVLTKKCPVNQDPLAQDNPLTDIDLEEATRYVAWIAERTGKKYRLPTSAEWLHAARANGKQPAKNFNCRVVLEKKIIKGAGLTSTRSGASNGWGLKNYVGNAQEWALNEGKTSVHGGNYETPFSSCSLDLMQSSNGEANKRTGFRVIFEL